MFRSRSQAVSKSSSWQCFAAMATIFIMLTGVSPAISQQVNTSNLTFADHVAPIIYDNCVECHRPGSIAPMSLVDYATVRALSLIHI